MEVPGVRAGQRPGTAGRSQRQGNFKVSGREGGAVIHRQLHFFFSESASSQSSCARMKKRKKIRSLFPLSSLP